MENPYINLWEQRRHRSAWADAQGDQSIRCPHEELTSPWLPSKCTVEAYFLLNYFAGWSGNDYWTSSRQNLSGISVKVSFKPISSATETS